MKLYIYTANGKHIKKENVEKVTFKSDEGDRTILPNHTDYICKVNSGILSYAINNEDKAIIVHYGLLQIIGGDIKAYLIESIYDEHIDNYDKYVEMHEKIDKELTGEPISNRKKDYLSSKKTFVKTIIDQKR